VLTSFYGIPMICPMSDWYRSHPTMISNHLARLEGENGQ
jgi:hypothetical protein